MSKPLLSFIDVAPESHFSLPNLPYGIFRPNDGPARAGVAIGVDRLYTPFAAGRGLLAHPIASAAIVLGVYGVAYFLGAFLAGVPEAKRTIGRLL